MKKITSKKVKKKSKRTGRSLEWSCCRSLSLNFSNEDSDELFSPSRGSGSIFTRRMKSGKGASVQQGDLVLSHSDGQLFTDLFSLECKLGYMGKRKTDKGIIKTTWGPLDILDSQQDKTTLQEFWEQTIKDAQEKEPLLCFRRNNRSTCIVMYQDVYQKCVHLFGIPKGDVLNIDFNSHDLIILNFKFFLEWVKIKNLCENILKEKEINKKILIQKTLIQKTMNDENHIQGVYKRWIRFEIHNDELKTFLFDREKGKEFEIQLKEETLNDINNILLKNGKIKDYIY